MDTQTQLLEAYQTYLARSGKSEHTLKAYLSDARAFWKWHRHVTDTPDALSVDPRDIQDYRAYLAAQGRATGTINRRLNALRNFFKWAKSQGHISDNPFDWLEKVTIKNTHKPAPKWLTDKEQRALLRAVRRSGNLRDVALVQLLLGTGLRISEVSALQMTDVDISARRGWLKVRHGKGMKAREIPLSKKTRQALQAYLVEREGDSGDALFLGQRGTLNPPGIDYLIRKYAYQAQLPHCSAHTLRHTFAKNLVDAGVSLDQVAMLLGHESLDTTKIYIQPSRRDLEKAVWKIDNEL